MIYEEFPPPAKLTPWVRCIWHLEGDGVGAGADPVIPDGCAELLLNCADPFTQHAPGGAIRRQPLIMFAGPLSTAIRIAPIGRIDLWGIRLHPWSVFRTSGLPAGELRDNLPAAGDLSTHLADLGERVVNAPPASRRAAIERELEGLFRGVQLPNRSLRAAVATVSTTGSAPSVRSLASDLGVSSRLLQMNFAHHVGLSPKTLMRIGRFQRALGLARENRSFTWSRIAQMAGYHDHSHLDHDAQDLAGCAPSVLVNRDPGLTELFLAD